MIRQIAFLIYPDFQLLDAAGPIAAFEIAARYQPASYTLRVIAAEPGLVTGSSGASMQARPFGRARGIDTLVIAGGDGSRSPASCPTTLRSIPHSAAPPRPTPTPSSPPHLMPPPPSPHPPP